MRSRRHVGRPSLASPVPAGPTTNVTGVVNWIAAHSDNGTDDAKRCFSFEIGNSATISPTTGQYEINSADPLYSDEVGLIVLAYLTGQPLSFVDTGTTNSSCNSLEHAFGSKLGTLY